MSLPPLLLACLALRPDIQQIERTDDHMLTPTGATATLQIDRCWIKVEGRWHEMPKGSLEGSREVGGKSAKYRSTNLRVRATGFKVGHKKVAALSILTYDEFTRRQDKGWILHGPSLKLLVICLSGSLGAPPSEWNKADIWQLPSKGSYIATMDHLMEYWNAAKGYTFLASDQYVVKSLTAKWPTLTTSNADPLVWGVFPAQPKAGAVIRLQLPTEAGLDGDQSWDKFYLEVAPANWRAFSERLRSML